MSRRLRTPSIVAICALSVSLLAGPQVVKADGVDDAKKKLAQILDDLENLRNEMAQVVEDYDGALDRQETLSVEIEAAQTRVDEMTVTLGDVQGVVQQIAINKYTSGDSFALSPLFSNAASYSLAGQRSALSTIAINSGEGSIDDLEAIVDDLAAERAVLATKQEEAAQLIATLETKKVDMAALEEDYLARYSKAEKELGKAKLRAAEAARERAAKAQEEMARAVRQQQLDALPRGAGARARYTGDVPAVSGSAGIAVAAAYAQIGVPYVSFAASPDIGFDCSGLTQWVWGRAGVKLPHQSGAQSRVMPEVNREDMQPGDLVFYQRFPMHHVAIYVGNDMVISAPAPGKYVSLVKINWNNVTSIGRPG
ncbi:MAG: C40 family peptidase [Actinomycetia bacterium]|nr:C40 family peptidase [Actinomycetes bacterium]